jgi:CheY-like chemotaxis protein
MNGFELYDKIKKDNKVKVCFISAYDVGYDAFREQFPTLEIDCMRPKSVIRKPIQIANLIERMDVELVT